MKTIEEMRPAHDAALEVNRALPVVAHVVAGKGTPADQPSDRVFEVTDGFKYVRDGATGQQERLAPGRRFRPTERELRENARALAGKARELTATERRGLSIAGADIGLRTLPMTESALKMALNAGLSEQDFAGLKPDGTRYTKEQVEKVIVGKPHSA